jgi:predicted nucleic acid-binding protein
MRAVLDANVLISAILSRRGTPAALLLAWQAGAFELIVSPLLLAELRRALAYPKLARLVPAADAEAYVDWLSRSARVAGITLAAAERAVLVSGDAALSSLAHRIPVRTPAAFLAELER